MTTRTEARCPWCHFESPPAYADRRRRMAACPSCLAWFVWPPPSSSAALARYQDTVDGMPSDLRQWRVDTNQGKWYEHVADRLRRVAGDRDVVSVVDVGAGGLELTASLARSFPRAHVQAWDLASKPSATVGTDIAERVTFRSVDLNRPDVAFGSGQVFDVVACVAVIEHVLDPAGLLRGLQSITRPGGFAYVVGPEVRSLAHRVMGEAWPYYSPDDHLTLPSLLSIEKALARGHAGSYRLRRVSVRYSLKYLMRFLRMPFAVPAAMDVVLPIPAGAFELIWWRPPVAE